jgi:Domain of Unknown Function (DUF1080)
MNWRRAILVLAALAAMLRCPSSASAEERWIQLFNGRDLTGWTPKIVGHKAGDNFADTFRVEDGILEVRYDKYDGDFQGRFGHLFYDRPFSHYKIRAEYRFVGEQAPGAPTWALRNNGIMIHGQSAESMGLNQSFPISMEFQLLGGDGQHERPTGSLCMPGTRAMHDGKLLTAHCTNSTSKTFHGDQWVTAEAEVHGGRLIRHLINGDVVFEYNEPRLDEKDPDAKRLLEAGAEKMLTSGTISLQSESHPCDFRKVELMELEE